ncbi:DUF2946 family protein [Xanthobacter sp. TB0139]|uniref:DUF2946 family protein n=1 Tax=Xanthobacter sp. TB0139 TaxID=3459178 RepID=UPI0040398216
MRWNTGKTRSIRWVAAWTAAYALVFQVLLTTTLIASMPRGVGAVETCFASTLELGGGANGNADDTTSRGHCPACLARVDLLALPPPLALLLPFRISTRTQLSWLQPAPLHLAARKTPGQPRAPPFLLT